MRLTRTALLSASAAVVAAGAPSAEAPPAFGSARRHRYYDPGARPYPQRVDRPTPGPRKKKPTSDADFDAIGRADLKRERKSARRRREALRQRLAEKRP